VLRYLRFGVRMTALLPATREPPWKRTRAERSTTLLRPSATMLGAPLVISLTRSICTRPPLKACIVHSAAKAKFGIKTDPWSLALTNIYPPLLVSPLRSTTLPEDSEITCTYPSTIVANCGSNRCPPEYAYRKW